MTVRIENVEPRNGRSLEEYENAGDLHSAVEEMRRAADEVLARMRGRGIWMLSSTATGGGVAEILHSHVSMLRQLGLETRWLVMHPEDPAFFTLTKRLHNMIHGADGIVISGSDRALYDEVSRQTADAVAEIVRDGDLLLVHDPQPLGAGALLRESLDIAAIWRCHIGLDRQTAVTRSAWEFVCPLAAGYDRTVFTVPEYIPDCLNGSTVIQPSIDPLSPKNRPLTDAEVETILDCARVPRAPADPGEEPESILRFEAHGSWGVLDGAWRIPSPDHLLVTQISRWDRLKGFLPLMRAFVRLKESARSAAGGAAEEFLCRARLILAGPDPRSIQDDPEATKVLDEICGEYLGLANGVRNDVAILSLPMSRPDENSLMVNALQRASTVVVQNSLQEGFGLTVTEAMWKGRPVLGSAAVGIRHQIRSGADGMMVEDPENTEEIAACLHMLLADAGLRARLGERARKRVAEEYLIFRELTRWLRLMGELAG